MAAVALVALWVAAVPAQASDDPGGGGGSAPAGCPAGYFCVWVNANFNDGPGKWQSDAPNYEDFVHASCPLLGSLHTWRNCASSAYNHGNNCDIRVYSGQWQQGGYLRIARGTGISNLANYSFSNGINANDSIESHLWC